MKKLFEKIFVLNGCGGDKNKGGPPPKLVADFITDKDGQDQVKITGSSEQDTKGRKKTYVKVYRVDGANSTPGDGETPPNFCSPKVRERTFGLFQYKNRGDIESGIYKKDQFCFFGVKKEGEDCRRIEADIENKNKFEFTLKNFSQTKCTDCIPGREPFDMNIARDYTVLEVQFYWEYDDDGDLLESYENFDKLYSEKKWVVIDWKKKTARLAKIKCEEVETIEGGTDKETTYIYD